MSEDYLDLLPRLDLISSLKGDYSSFCASVLLITMGGGHLNLKIAQISHVSNFSEHKL